MSLTAAATLSPLAAVIARAAAATAPIYHLPYPGSVVWTVIQGNNSAFSHNGRAAFAWDFRMPTGSPIVAARDGVVAMLKQDQTQHCNDLSCPDWNNYIVVDHGDGTSAAYLHGMQNGARVQIGQAVKQGQHLGLSDNTGQSGGPHLHFQVQYNEGRYLSQSFQIGFPEVSEKDGVPLTRKAYQSANQRLLDFDMPNGRYYTQTNGAGGGGGKGFSVFDDVSAPMWTSLKTAGGVDVVGYPISRRFSLAAANGHWYQAFQKQIFDWDPVANQLQLLNVMDMLHDSGRDGWLAQQREVPIEADFSDADSGRSWDEVVKAHLALLDAQEDIKAAYFATADPIDRYGLPMSGIADTADSLMLRTQRAVFQLWKHDVPWAKSGTVTIANAGELARDAQLFSDNIFEPEQLLPETPPIDTRLPWEIPGFNLGMPLY